MTEEAWLMVGLWFVSAGVLFGQNLSNNRHLSKGQDDMRDEFREGQKATNDHLEKLNDRTAKNAQGLATLATRVNLLPCREGGSKWTTDDCDAAMSDED